MARKLTRLGKIGLLQRVYDYMENQRKIVSGFYAQGLMEDKAIAKGQFGIGRGS